MYLCVFQCTGWTLSTGGVWVGTVYVCALDDHWSSLISIIVKQRLSTVAGIVCSVLCIVLTAHRGGWLVWLCIVFYTNWAEGSLVWYCVLCIVPTEQRGGWLVWYLNWNLKQLSRQPFPSLPLSPMWLMMMRRILYLYLYLCLFLCLCFYLYLYFTLTLHFQPQLCFARRQFEAQPVLNVLPPFFCLIVWDLISASYNLRTVVGRCLPSKLC